MSDAHPAMVDPIVDQIRPLLAGQPAELVGAVLADLLAIWLAGHIIPDDPAETNALREALLDFHIRLVRRLIPVHAAAIHGSAA